MGKRNQSFESGSIVIFLVAGLVIFIGIHSIRIIAPAWRDKTIESVGENAWKAIYSVVSLISFVLLIYGYSLAKSDAGQIYPPLSGMYHPLLLLMALALILMMASNLGPGHIKQKAKHPFLLAIILWSVPHLWVNGDAASVVLFGTFLVWAVIDFRSALKRPKTKMLEPVLRNDIIAVVSGLGIYALFVWKLHEALIGVAPSI